jgi:hypothetical protein
MKRTSMPINSKQSSDNNIEVATQSIALPLENSYASQLDYEYLMFKIDKSILYEYALVRQSWKMSGIIFLFGVVTTIVAYFIGEETKLISSILILVSALLAALPWKDGVTRKSKLNYLKGTKALFEYLIKVKDNTEIISEVDTKKLREMEGYVNDHYKKTIGL